MNITENTDAKKCRERFLQIYNDKIKREGADALLDFLTSKSSDFFVAPASARFHNAA